MQVSQDSLQEQRLGRLPLPEDHTRAQDNSMVKAQLFDSILHPDFHLAVRHVYAQQTACARAGDEDVCLHVGLLRRLGVLDAQVVVDLPLVLDPAGGSSGGAHGVEDNRRMGTEGRDHISPFGCVGFLLGFKLRRLGRWWTP